MRHAIIAMHCSTLHAMMLSHACHDAVPRNVAPTIECEQENHLLHPPSPLPHKPTRAQEKKSKHKKHKHHRDKDKGGGGDDAKLVKAAKEFLKQQLAAGGAGVCAQGGTGFCVQGLRRYVCTQGPLSRGFNGVWGLGSHVDNVDSPLSQPRTSLASLPSPPPSRTSAAPCGEAGVLLGGQATARGAAHRPG